MEYISTGIEGVVILRPKVFGDSRGYFYESYVKRDFDEFMGREINFVQDNESRSVYGVVRGLHFQKGDAAQAKLVRCTRGRVLDVALDIRPGSPTYGRHVEVELTEEGHEALFIPRGFAHGFAVLSEDAVFQYKCDNYYSPADEGGFFAFDPALGIDWRLNEEDVVRSPKDLLWPKFRP